MSMGSARIDDADRRCLTGLKGRIANPELGLPEPVFDFALHIVPMVNVDLLVLDEVGRMLLAWREDVFGRGWHIPGGIIRVRETMADRIRATALNELGCAVTMTSDPLSVLESFGERGHFVSLLFACTLDEQHKKFGAFVAGGEVRPGMLAWFEDFPAKTYPSHHAYIAIIKRLRAEGRVAGSRQAQRT